MTAVAGLSGLLLVLILGKAGGVKPNSGYCIGNSCFTLFRDPSPFTSAQGHCRDQGGHLMTVRTSVSNDVLSVLLGNQSGSFWIGLHRLSGCPDPLEELRGFQWVTKDTETDFTYWTPGSDGNCSAARCVSVNPEENFRWSQTPCEQPAAGFLCEHIFRDPCVNLPHEPHESVVYQIPFGFEMEGTQTSTLPPGSIATRSPDEMDEIKYICFLERWLQAPWKCEISEGGCDYRCAVDSTNTPICFCPPGESLDPRYRVSCKAGDPDDPCRALGCQQSCYAVGSEHRCGCEQGLQLAADGRSCVDLDECADERQCPDAGFRCVNTPQGFACVCEDGYRLHGGACTDLDECVHAPCEHECTNTAGSYVCACYSGYRVDDQDPHKCKLHCGEEECPATCDPNDRFQCFCPDGYVSEERWGGTFCIDIDECEFQYCDHGCSNTYGGYVCSCPPGSKLVEHYRCVEEVPDGSPTPSILPSPTSPHPDPTGRPSSVTAGGLVGIIVCTVVLVVLAVFLAHLGLLRRGRKERVKGAEEETHGLRGLSGSHGDKVV